MGVTNSWRFQVYWLQFGRYFARGPVVGSIFLNCTFLNYQRVDVTSNPHVNCSTLACSLLQERDDYALELAMGDE